MRVRMKVQMSGTRNGQSWPGLGEMVEVGDQEGADMCAAGLAEPVAADKVETAVTPEPEKRTSRKRG